MDFIGREAELELLSRSLKKESAAVLIYGKRKVGKTTLIKECLKAQEAPFVYYECLKGTIQDNVASFTEELKRIGILPAMISLDSFANGHLFFGCHKTEKSWIFLRRSPVVYTLSH